MHLNEYWLTLVLGCGALKKKGSSAFSGAWTCIEEPHAIDGHMQQHVSMHQATQYNGVNVV